MLDWNDDGRKTERHTVIVSADLVEALRVEVRIVDEQQICEGEPHTEKQVAELNRLYEAAADLVDSL